jgi:thioredoxin-dependent peroxiredoxin
MERTVTLMGNPQPLTGPELKKGDAAPDFHLVDDSLQPVDLAKTGTAVRIFSVVPSLDTPVCDAQTRRLNTEVPSMGGIEVYSISMDLPFAQKRWCRDFGVDQVKMLSDHRDGTFGASYGALLKEARLLCRALFVIDQKNTIQYAEYVPEVADHPNYDAALAAAKGLA